MNSFSSTLAVRALNHWRPEYIPTYIALRLFLKQVPQSEQSDFLLQFIKRKMGTGELSNYRKFCQFKGKDNNIDDQCRKLYAASPATALGEAYLLSLLENVEGLSNKPHVFSYKWPSKKAGRSYSYFFSGYKERLNRTTSILNLDKNQILLVHDIRKFYPSVNRAIVLERLQDHLKHENLSLPREIIGKICNDMLDKSEEGIPIGPALGHIFGNLALEQIDTQMSADYKDRYLRYVDDIFIIVKPGDVDAAQKQIEDVSKSENFKLHDEQGKRDEVSAEDWLANVITPEEQKLAYSFNKDIFKRIRLLLWIEHKKLKPLQSLFRERGIPMPILRLSQDAKYSRFQRYMWPDIGDIFHVFLDNEYDILATVEKLRGDFIEAAKKIEIMQTRNHSTIRKLRVQRLRYLLNRLLYLVPIEKYDSLLQLAPDIDEFFAYRSLVRALLDRSLDSILKVPGRTVSAYSATRRELGMEGSYKYNEELLESQEVFDSICTLLPYGMITVPESWVKRLSPTNSEVIKFVQFSIPEARILDDHSYEDEIRSLQLGSSKAQLDDILSEPFNDTESIDLDPLTMPDYSS